MTTKASITISIISGVTIVLGTIWWMAPEGWCVVAGWLERRRQPAVSAR